MCHVDFIYYVVLLNISLSGLHWVLQKLHDRKACKWNESALKAVEFLLTMLEWLMAARTGKRK